MGGDTEGCKRTGHWHGCSRRGTDSGGECMDTMMVQISNADEAVAVTPETRELKGTNLNDTALTTVIGRVPSLQRIDLAGCDDLTDDSVARLVELKGLQEIDLRLCGLVTDASCRAISTLPHLRYLCLGWCFLITDSGLEGIRDSRTLETLLLWGCEEITDRGIRAIAGLPHLTRLELPELSAISDAAILELASESSRLKILRLTSLKAVSDIGIAALVKISGLEHLVIQACPSVTEASVKSLRIALPNCHIEYSER